MAAALVGYDAVNAAGVRLLDEKMLNTVLVLVVVTSIVGPVLTERFVRRLTGLALASGAAPRDAALSDAA